MSIIICPFYHQSRSPPTVRDTCGTALYFFEYDAMRHLLGRKRSGEQGRTPTWLPIHASLIPFACGSLAGVSSWALIYPLDVVKTKIQQRALAGTPPKTVFETLHRLVRGKWSFNLSMFRRPFRFTRTGSCQPETNAGWPGTNIPRLRRQCVA